MLLGMLQFRLSSGRIFVQRRGVRSPVHARTASRAKGHALTMRSTSALLLPSVETFASSAN
jgi:hypothetical protein